MLRPHPNSSQANKRKLTKIKDVCVLEEEQKRGESSLKSLNGSQKYFGCTSQTKSNGKVKRMRNNKKCRQISQHFLTHTHVSVHVHIPHSRRIGWEMFLTSIHSIRIEKNIIAFQGFHFVRHGNANAVKWFSFARRANEAHRKSAFVTSALNRA